MKRALSARLIYTFLFLFGMLIPGCSNKEQAKDEHVHSASYTCPMHPQGLSDKPGTCPVCQMDLVPVNRTDSHAGVDASLENLVKPSNQLVISQIRTVRPREGVRANRVNLQGVINYDTNNWGMVSSRVGGRIERLYVTYNYQYVNKGQKLMDIYSPDLANAQQELLYLKSTGDKALLEAAKSKLRLLGASNGQISAVLRSGKVDYSVSVYSPLSGYIAEQKSESPSTGSYEGAGAVISEEGKEAGMSEMSGSTAGLPSQIPQVETNSPIMVREGQYVSSGQKIFSLINAGTVWADFFAGADQLQYLKKGTSIQLASVDNSSQKAVSKINLVQPYYSGGTSFTRMRAKIDNPGMKWKVGQLISISTDVSTNFGNWLPRTAVLQMGTRYVAFVKNGGAFVPVYVKIKQHSGDWVDVADSLRKDQDVALNAWFMVDSESFVKVDSLRSN